MAPCSTLIFIALGEDGERDRVKTFRAPAMSQLTAEQFVEALEPAESIPVAESDLILGLVSDIGGEKRLAVLKDRFATAEPLLA